MTYMLRRPQGDGTVSLPAARAADWAARVPVEAQDMADLVLAVTEYLALCSN